MIRPSHATARPRPPSAARSLVPVPPPPCLSSSSSLSSLPSRHHPALCRSTTTPPRSPRQCAIGHCRALHLAAYDRGGGAGGGAGGASPSPPPPPPPPPPPRPPRRTGGGGNDGGDGDDAPKNPPRKKTRHSLVPGTAAAFAFAALAGWAAWDTLPTAGVDESALRARVSVVIPCLNERAAIEHTLALACGRGGQAGSSSSASSPSAAASSSSSTSSSSSFASLPSLSPPPLEVIVVDGGSTDGTAELAERWARRHNREVERRRKEREEEEQAREEEERRQRQRQQRGKRKEGEQRQGDGGAGETAPPPPPPPARGQTAPPPDPPTVRVVRLGRRGRAVQMNAGAAAARGELLAFLHADTAPPCDLVGAARGWFRDRRNVLLGFVPSIEVDDAWLEARREKRERGQGGGAGPSSSAAAAAAAAAGRNNDNTNDNKRPNAAADGGDASPKPARPNRTHALLAQSAHNTVKTLLYPALLRPAAFARGLRLLFGDQVLVVRSVDLRRAGGFDERYSIMEDADLCLRLHKQGPFVEGASLVGGGREGNDGAGGGSAGRGKGGRRRGARDGPSEANEASAAAELRRWALQPSEAAFEPGPWLHPRGRVRMDCRRLARTSGRRLAAWGFLRGSVTNFRIASAWYFLHSPEKVRELYVRLYTDAFR